MTQKTNNTIHEYDTVIVGAGITGTALLYTLSKYTNLKSIALIEKYKSIASLNSNSNNNSQTLHFGDIESNYTFEKAKKVSKNAELVAGFLEKNGKVNHTYYKKHKLLLGVGEEQIKVVKKRVNEFKSIFPNIKFLDKEEVTQLEPLIKKGRSPEENFAALYSPDGYAIDYGRLAELFVEKTKQGTNQNTIDIQLSTKILKIKKSENGYILIIKKEGSKSQTIHCKILLVCAGAHSLILAKQVGVGKEIGVLPISGTFFSTNRKVLNGKVYTLQKEKLPFAAIHGDPNVNDANETRFGPTARVLPILEKGNWSTIPDFLKTSAFTFDGIISLWKVISDPIIFFYTLKNVFYDLPIIGKRLFLKEIKKIIPSISLKELDYTKNIGGIRPQVIDTKTKKLIMGQGKLYANNAIFNITPSPGASNCLSNARDDAIRIKEFLGEEYHFDLEGFVKDNSRE